MTSKSKNCLICNQTFLNRRKDNRGHWIGKYTLKGWKNAKFCSYKCYWANGRDEKTKEIMKKTMFKKGMIPWTKGKIGLRGEKSPNWKGGITGERHLLMGQLEYKL